MSSEIIKANILWADDEIDLLKPYILFLKEKGYDVVGVNNGLDAIDMCFEQSFDIVFLDEHMPGISGLQTLTEINKSFPDIPIIMITKSEDEGIMEKAIGEKIADYLIKPVNPHQILLAIKKVLDRKEIINEISIESYRREFSELGERISNCSSVKGWVSIYRDLVSWEMTFADTSNPMSEILQMQKQDANIKFSKYIRDNYISWFDDNNDDSPLLSHQVFKKMIFPEIDKSGKTFVILVDNFRLDQWLSIKKNLLGYFSIKEDYYYSILPTATQYARNSIFAGRLPSEISQLYPQIWKDESSDEGKNLSEDELFRAQLEDCSRNETFSYHKINSNAEGDRLLSDLNVLEKNDLNIIVFNFIDILSHAKSEQKMLQELVPNDAAYRSLTNAWFEHSPLFALLKMIAAKGYKVILTTDHGTIRVKSPLRVITDKSVNTNTRYKVGRNMTYDTKKVFEITEPKQVGLPSPNLSSRYIFALNDSFFAYPNNFNNFVSFYEDTYQHGGVSMEEMIVPFATLSPK